MLCTLRLYNQAFYNKSNTHGSSNCIWKRRLFGDIAIWSYENSVFGSHLSVLECCLAIHSFCFQGFPCGGFLLQLMRIWRVSHIFVLRLMGVNINFHKCNSFLILYLRLARFSFISYPIFTRGDLCKFNILSNCLAPLNCWMFIVKLVWGFSNFLQYTLTSKQWGFICWPTF